VGSHGLETRPKGAKPRDIKERTFEFALAVVRLCRGVERRSQIDRTLAMQLLRSGTSIGANVQEAQAGQSRADFINKYSIALKEARETAYWLRLLDASEVSPDGRCKEVIGEVEEIGKILGAIIVKTKSRGAK